MRRFKRFAAVGCSVLMLFASLGACNAKMSKSSTDNSQTNDSTTINNSSSVYGKVTAIDGTTVTLALGEMKSVGGKGENPPAKPSDNSGSTTSNSDNSSSNSGSAPSGNMADKPNGTPPGGTAPSGIPGNPPNGGPGGTFTANGKTSTITITDESIIKVQEGPTTKAGSLSDIKVGTILALVYATDGSLSSVTIQSSGGMGAPGGNGGSSGGSETGSITLTGAYTVDGTEKTSSNEAIETAKANENAVLVKNNGKLNISGATIKKSGDSTSTDESNFYALNSAVAATSKSTISISDSTLTSAAEGANAIFAAGSNSKITASNVTINTTGNSSRGLDATFGGTIIADKMNITTKGAHCAPVATDRGEGNITITNSTLNAAGDGSPCIYCTGNIKARNVNGTATGSQAAVIEGKNSITLNKSNLTGAGKNGIMIYQSTSGDAAVGVGKLTSKNSTITSNSTGEMFYITNTDAEVDLTNTTLNFSSGILLNAAGNSTNNWGTPGSNGGNVTLNGTKQKLTGDITCDKISKVICKLKKSTILKGSIDKENTGNVTISLDSSSKWIVTGTSYITSITDKKASLSNIVSNGNTIYYDSSNKTNRWLKAKTISLSDGGKLTPMK